jgi:putative NIF3 family GTP cyclohydrolase 1 type 2
MKISDIISCLESFAPREYQEEYDNAGLLTGSPDWDCTGVLVTLDSPESIVREAMQKKCNLVVSHHPIIFGGLNKLTGSNYVENAVLTAIRNNIAIYATHTNLDNQLHGVNGKIAEKLGLINQSIGSTIDSLYKLFTFAPKHMQKGQDARLPQAQAILEIIAKPVSMQREPEHLRLEWEQIHLLRIRSKT